jgi:RHS repeat-associated protein
MASGAFVFAAEDMATGIEGAPRGLAFARNYSSSMASRDEQNLGYGWMHNFHIRAVARTASDEALGMGSPQQAAALLAAVTAASDLYRKDASPKEWGVAALAVGWFVDQMKDNAVSVRMGKDIFQFIKQPDGSFTAPPGSTMILTKATDGTYRLQQRLGNTIEFDAAGKATRIVDVDGRAMTFNYNANGTINYVEDAVGRRYTFGYNGTHITSVADSTSPRRSVKFGYDPTNWNLTSATDPEEKVSYFDYSVEGDPGGTTDGQHRIVRLRNHDKETITQNVWDSLGRVVRQFLHGDTKDSDTNKIFCLYYTGRDNFEVNPQGGVTHYYYDERGRAVGSKDPDGNVNSMTYDGQDRIVTRTTGANETTKMDYDDAHNLKRIDHPRGGGSTLMEYDSLNRLDLVTDPNGIKTDYVYFTSGNDVGKDRPESVISANGTVDQSTTAFTYWQSGVAVGRVHTIKDGDNLTTQKNYDALGQPDITTLPGSFTINEDYSDRGNLDAITDPNLKKTSYTYNKRRQRTSEVADSAGVAATSNATFDNQARVATVTPPADNAGQRPQQSLTYNPTDKVRLQKLNTTTVADTAYDKRDWVATVKDASNRTTTLVHKASGAVEEAQRPGARTTKFSYDGDSRVTSTQNPGANSGTRNEGFVYDTTGGGKPRTVKTEADGKTVTSEYDAKGQLRFLKDRRGATFEFRYDALGRRTHVITPTSRTTKTEYKKNGRAASVTELSGDSATFTYNATTGRLSSVDYAGTGGATVNYTGYDSSGNLLSLNEGGNGTITRTYDGLNRVTSYTEAGKTIEYRYYASGKLAKVIYPGGMETGVGHIEYTYNADGRLYQVIDRLSSTTTPRTTSYFWRTDGRLASVTRPNGTTRTITTYDAVGRPEVITESAGLVWTIGYWPSDDIRTLDMTPAIPANQLSAVRNASMKFDSANQLATFNGQTVTHDLDGNMVSGPLPTTGAMGNYTYDSRNRLTGAGGFAYRYNAEGNRVGLTSANETTTLTVDPQGALPKVLERVKNGVRTRYVYGLGLQYEVNDAGSATYYHYDQTGNTAALTNQAGAIIERVVYSPYGTIRYRQSNFDTPFLYGGFFGVMTDANGLINMRARYYNPLTMRFLNSDPAMDGLNWYAYANGNPINFADPTGYGAQKVLGAMNSGLNALGMVGGAITTGIQNYNNTAATVWTAVVGNVASGFDASAVNRLQEANHHYRNGQGARVTVDSSGLDFSALKRRTEQRGYTFPNFSSGDFLVHGSVSLTPQDNGANLKISDTYNFDIKPWSPDNFNRNVATMISHFAADPLDFYTNWSGERGKGWAYWNGSGAYPFEFSPATITNPK